MTDELKTIKFQMMLAPSEAEKIDDWGFERRIRSRAEAIRQLCDGGFALDEIGPQILAALENLEAFRNTPENERDFSFFELSMEALYSVLGPVLIGRIGVRSMKEMAAEVDSSSAVAALWKAAEEKRK